MTSATRFALAAACASRAALAAQKFQLHQLADSLAIVGADGAEDLVSEGLRDDDDSDPVWGCGLVGHLPGVSPTGEASPETQRLIDGIKKSSSFNKAWYWNWNLAPSGESEREQHLTKDFLFMPEQWGVAPVKEALLRPAGEAHFPDSNGVPSPASMADIFLGYNEPDIRGSCMGDLFGECVQPCDKEAIEKNDCPAARLHPVKGGYPNSANKKGQCDCWKFSQATGAGFWPVEGCSVAQPLPTLFEDGTCVDVVMAHWRDTARVAMSKGYKYLTTPLVATSIDYARQFLTKACATCQDISCGCPVYVAFHFYAYDCQPEKLKGYATFKKRLNATAKIMEEFPFVKGAIINEVGMLNCGDPSSPVCVPDSGQYPASEQDDGGCPATDELPKGIPSFLDRLFDHVIAAKTSDGRPVVKAFAWFNENGAGGTYDLRLFDEDGQVSNIGEAYMKSCARWGHAQRQRRHKQ